MAFLRKWLFRFAQTALGGSLLSQAFSRFSFAIPVDRLEETESLLAFFHPRPAYPLHILIVPRRPFRTWMDVPPGDAFLSDYVRVSQRLIQRFELERKGYRLIVNGGPHQDVAHLHIHLVSECVGEAGVPSQFPPSDLMD